MFDVVMRGGTVVDGGGGVSVRADVGVEGDRITAVGDLSSAEAARAIDARGLVVAPGFVDIHTHSDLPLVIDPRGMSKVHQGVTTEVIGNCGMTPYPAAPERLQLLKDMFPTESLVDWTWLDLAGYREAVMRQGVGVNIAPLVGHSAVRGARLGFDDRPTTPDELTAMQRLVTIAMEQGAFGLSTGLTLPPSAYGSTQEIVALCQAMSAFPGRFYTTHMRVWTGEHVKSIKEAIEIGRLGGVPVQLSHMAINDPPHWGEAEQVIAVCAEAAERGQDVTFDVYPYAASSSGFSQCLPTWAQSGGRKALAARIHDPTTRALIREDMEDNGLFRGWPWMWDRLMICRVINPELQEYEGLTIQEAADKLDLDPFDAALELMDRDEARMGIIFFYRTEEDMRAFLRHPMGMMGSDGSAIAADGPLSEGKPHPRSYGAHVRVLGRYVREEPVLTLEQAVYKLSGQVADRLGMKDRGHIAVGQHADIAIFDPATVIDRATFADPHQYAEGVPYVLVNGVLAVDGGVRTDALAGRVLSAS